jgi:hypothetical protein
VKSGEESKQDESVEKVHQPQKRGNVRKGLVGSWCRQALTCLALASTVLGACAEQVVNEMKEVIIEPAEDVRRVFKTTLGHERPACAEAFAGWAEVTLAFSEDGRTFMEPRDIIYGHDLRCKENRENYIKIFVNYVLGLLWWLSQAGIGDPGAASTTEVQQNEES